MNSRTPLGAAAILALAAISAVPAAAQAPVVPVSGAQVLDGSWDGTINAESGLPKSWAGIQVRPRGRKVCFAVTCARHAFKLTTAGVRDGTKAARFEVRDGDNPFGDSERAETQMLPEAGQGAERWYTWSTLMTDAFRANGANGGSYLTITRWSNDKGGAAPVGFYVNQNQLTLQVNLQKSTKVFTRAARPWGVPLASVRNRWVDYAMHVKWSANGDGFIELFVDGVPQAMNWPFGGEGNNPATFGGVGATRLISKTMVPRAGKVQIKQGIVRATNLSGPTVIFHDAMRAYDAARPAPVTPLPPAPPVTP